MRVEENIRTSGDRAATVGGASDDVRTAPWIASGVSRVEGDERLDAVAERLGDVAHAVAEGRRGEILRGAWLGHALHPLLTDVPLGFFMSASVLDVVGGSRSRHAARRLAALGVLTAVPTAAAGLAEFPALADARTRRVGAAHAVGNGAVIFCYLQSWLARRRGRHGRGVAWGLAGGSLAWASGYLGGHLSFARGVGHGFRGMRDPAQRDVAPAPGLAAPATAFEENLR